MIKLIFMPDGRVNNGGFRPGAGVPAGRKQDATLKRDEAKMLLMDALRPHAAAVAKALAEKAETGDVAAIKEFHDRYLGKSVQPIEASGPDGRDLPTPILLHVLTHNSDKESVGDE